MDKCASCGSACTDCVSNAGGMACADRCESCSGADIEQRSPASASGEREASNGGSSTSATVGLAIGGCAAAAVLVAAALRSRRQARTEARESLHHSLALVAERDVNDGYSAL